MGLCTVYGRGQLDELAPGRATDLFSVLHQKPTDATMACRVRNHEGCSAHNRTCVSKHSTQVRCEKPNYPIFREGNNHYHSRSGSKFASYRDGSSNAIGAAA